MTADSTSALLPQIEEEASKVLEMVREGKPDIEVDNWGYWHYDWALYEHLGKLGKLCNEASFRLDLSNYELKPAWYWFAKSYWIGGGWREDGSILNGCIRTIEAAPSIEVLREYRKRTSRRVPGPNLKGTALFHKKSNVAVMIEPLKHFGKGVPVVHENYWPDKI